MHPYRESASSPPGDEEQTPSEEWAVAGLLAVLGGTRVAIAIARGEGAAVDVTVAGILGAIGVVLLARLLVGARR